MKSEKEIRDRIKNIKQQISEMMNSDGYMVHSFEIDEAYDILKVLEWVLEDN